MAIVKNIEQKIKINKVVSLSAIAFAVIIVISGFVFSYQLVKDARKSLYIIDNGVPVLVKQTDELLNRPVEYKSQVELFHRLFFTLPPDDVYIKQSIEQEALYLIDETGKKEYANLRERGFYNQIISSNAVASIETDSIKLDLKLMKFVFYGKQTINRRLSVIKRKLITEGFFENTIRSPKNAHGVMLKNWRILDNTEISKRDKYNY